MLRALSMYFITSLFLFFEMAVQVSPSVMSSQLMHALNIGSFGLGIMSGCYFYTYTAMQIPSGILLDKFNPRFVIVISILLCALGSFLLGFSNHIFFAALSRMIMGLGSAFAFVSVLVVTADLFDSKHFATLTGVTQMLAAFGAMSGQLPVQLLVTHIGWRETMFLFALIGVLIAAGVYYFLRYERNKTISTPQLHIKKIIANKQTWLIAAYACLLWAPMSGFTSLWGVPFLINVQHLSAEKAAFLCSLMWLGLAVASPLLGHLSTTFSNRKIPLAISAFIGVLSFGIILFFHPNQIWLGILLLLAGGACAGQALSFTVVKENNPREISATAIAFNNMAVVISGAIFQPLIGGLLHNDATHYRLALSVVLMAYILSFLLAAFFIRDSTYVRH